jgi:hypothetical protein
MNIGRITAERLGQFQKPKNIALCGTLDRGLTINNSFVLPNGLSLAKGF